MMKIRCIDLLFATIAGLLLICSPVSSMAALSGPSLLVIDSKEDLDTTVTIQFTDFGINYGGLTNVYLSSDGGEHWEQFTAIETGGTFEGGTLLNLAFDFIDGGIIDDDDLFLNDADISTFAGINSSFSENPVYSDTYYEKVTILWHDVAQLTILTADSTTKDGIAVVPIPSAALLLCTGVIGLIAFRRNSNKL